MKTMKINEKMKPELEAIQKKYGNDPKVVQMKQQEVYRKYQFNMMGTCLPMLVSMILQFVVFLTVWNSLQSVANYNIAEKYENMKDVYVSVINLNDETITSNGNLQADIQRAIAENKKYELNVKVNKKATKMSVSLQIEGEAEVVYENIEIKKNNGI